MAYMEFLFGGPSFGEIRFVMNLNVNILDQISADIYFSFVFFHLYLTT